MSRLPSVIDTCCLIYLCAAERPLDALFRELPLQLWVPRAVEREELSVRPRADAPKQERRPIDLGPHFASGLIERCDVETDAERDLYVQLAARLDDGEAMGLALAACRQYALATDDRPARRAAADLGVAVLTTPQIVRRWSDAVGLAPADLARVLSSIETLARYQPGPDLADYDWWMASRVVP